MDDKTLAAWILIAGSLAVGVWYWQLKPWDKLARLHKAALASAGSAAPVVPGSTPGYSWQPTHPGELPPPNFHHGLPQPGAA